MKEKISFLPFPKLRYLYSLSPFFKKEVLISDMKTPGYLPKTCIIKFLKFECKNLRLEAKFPTTYYAILSSLTFKKRLVRNYFEVSKSIVKINYKNFYKVNFELDKIYEARILYKN
ncbi:hypothetical protein LEP1GSC096_0284 [Leptospira interrogans serovar Hebdomadis str. R499]|nr:hypothetical protein LEP1GSC096_0284 [Leptospira interrogans serovar Hebdomadis str. R499]